MPVIRSTLLSFLQMEFLTRPLAREKGKRILLVNNAIHPGEPCGVDASMLLVKDYLSNAKLAERWENVVSVHYPFV